MGNTCGVVSAKKLFGSSRRRASSTSHRSATNSDDSSSKKKPQKQNEKQEKQQHEQEEARPTAKATVNVKEDATNIELLPGAVLGKNTENLKDLYSLGRKLGQGQFGTTYICTEISTGKDYACKSISKRKLISNDDVEDVRREVQIMHHLSGYKNVVSIKGAYEDQSHVHIVMELCSGGELFDRIIKRGHFSERKAAELTKIIVGVVEACHSLGVMHRDLKPENFLLLNKDDDSSLKAIDFGLSVFFKPGKDMGILSLS